MMFSRLCIGIIGGGQLARMSASAAIRLGFDVAILDNDRNAPACQLTHNIYEGWIDNDDVMKAFAERSDIITLENEFIDFHRLEFLENLGRRVVPNPSTIGLIQDKVLQKRLFEKAGIPVSKFSVVQSENDFQQLVNELGLPFILKARKMGYDGYGNAVINNEDEFKSAIIHLSNQQQNLFAEEFIDFSIEIASSVVRTSNEIRTYPIVETIQRGQICHTVFAPAEIEVEYQKEAEKICIASVEAVNGYGIFGIELFIQKDGKILVNEIAPRPHNSCHYSIEGCVTSQFENHIRAVLNLPLGSTAMVKKNAVMINILGKTSDIGRLSDYHSILEDEDIHLHIYGKGESQIGRKMGHITIVGDNPEVIYHRAQKISQYIVI